MAAGPARGPAAITFHGMTALALLLSSPIVATLLLTVGILGLVAEIKHGAFGLGGLVSVLSLGLFFGASLVLGLAGWAEVVLLGAGVIAVALEVFVLPGFGFAGLLGAACIATAIVMSMLGGAPTPGDVATALAVLGTSVVISGAVAYAWLRHLPRSERFRGLLLHGSTGSAEGYVAALPRAELVGRDGVAVTDLRPSGAAQVGEERLDVVTDGEFVPAGTPVRVMRSEGYRHVVRALPPS